MCSQVQPAGLVSPDQRLDVPEQTSRWLLSPARIRLEPRPLPPLSPPVWSLRSAGRQPDRQRLSPTPLSTPPSPPPAMAESACSPYPGCEQAAPNGELGARELAYPEPPAKASTYRTGFLSFGSVSHLNKQCRRWRRVNGVKKKLANRQREASTR